MCVYSIFLGYGFNPRSALVLTVLDKWNVVHALFFCGNFYCHCCHAFFKFSTNVVVVVVVVIVIVVCVYSINLGYGFNPALALVLAVLDKGRWRRLRR